MGFFDGGGLFGGGGGLFGGGSSSGSFGGSSYGGGSFGGYSGGVIRDDDNLLREVVKQSDTLAGELLRTVDDAKDEFQEICTDGMVEILIKGNKDYKTSFEIRDEADEKICEARNRYRDRCCEFNEYLEALNNKINALYEKKVELAKMINQKVGNMPNMPKISGYVTSPSYTYTPSTVSRIRSCSGIETLFNIRNRKEHANEYLEEANDFEVEISGKIAEINRMEAFLDTVKMNLDEEEMLLSALRESIEMRRDLAYSKVAEQLHILISEYILDTNGQKNKKYMDAVEQLRRLR